MNNTTTTVVVGGGIWGLACTRALIRGGHPGVVKLFEASGRPGGKIHSLSRSGFLIESAANGFLDTNPATINLCRDLGLGDRLVVASGTASRNRFVYLKGKLHRLPAGLWGGLTSGVISWGSKWRVFTERFRRPTIPNEDESIAAFGRRRLGRELTETLLDAFVTGIWAGDPEKLSVRSCFPRWHEWEVTHGSLSGGMLARRRERISEARLAGQEPPGSPRMWSLKGGLVELVDALAKDCNQAIRTNAAVMGLKHNPHLTKPWELQLEGETIQADQVVLATPPDAQAELLELLDKEISGELSSIPSNSICLVGLGFPKKDVPKHLDGFGYLSPQREGRPVLGVQWCSDIFPDLRAPEGMALWRALAGGPKNTEVLRASDTELVSTVREELARVTGLNTAPELVEVVRWPKAIPQYLVGHSLRLERIALLLGKFPGLFLGGSGFKGVALNDCVDQAHLMAKRVLDGGVDPF